MADLGLLEPLLNMEDYIGTEHLEVYPALQVTTSISLEHGSLFTKSWYSMADPGFPVGGGSVDSRGGYVSKIFYVKTKESGPLGGGVRRASANVDPPMVLKV